jgi:L-galactose dehydrogenase
VEYRRLGKTNLEVSVLSLGSGGPNQFGQVRHVRRSVIKELVRQALDLGINFFDTGSVYGDAESLLGDALQGLPRDRYVLSSKIMPPQGQKLMRAEEVRPLVEKSLRDLGVDEVDLFQLHRITPETYVPTVERLLPELERMRTEGKIRFLGITEASVTDPTHGVLQRALHDDFFDAVMLAYHPGNMTAADEILPLAREKDVGVVVMAAARYLVPRGLGQRLRLLPRALAGLAISPPDPFRRSRRVLGLGSLLRPGLARSAGTVSRSSAGPPLRLPASSYTFALSHPGVATVLTGTNDPAHLRENVDAALAPPLTPEDLNRLRSLMQP